jgi:ribonuclease-3
LQVLLLRDTIKAYFSKEKNLRKAIKNIFGFYPGNIFLYKLALRHKSVSLNKIEGFRINNERLEYLGDAVLSAVVADFLFKRFPFENEGILTEMRSKIVSRSSLNKLSVKLGLSKLILLSEGVNTQSKSAAGDAFEAFIGAIYLDKGYLFTKKILSKHIIPVHFDVDHLLESDINYKSKLIEWAQKEKYDLKFNVVKTEIKKHGKQYIVEVLLNGKHVSTGRDYSIKGAEKLAAEKGWELLGLPSPV